MADSTAVTVPELLHRARTGDGAALGQLLEQFRNYLLLLGRLQIGKRLQGKADATDLVQETFLEASRHFPRFRGSSEQELASWLRQSMVETAGGPPCTNVFIGTFPPGRTLPAVSGARH